MPTEPRDYWAELEAHQREEELDGLRRIHLPPEGRREEPKLSLIQRLREASGKSAGSRMDVDRGEEWEPD